MLVLSLISGIFGGFITAAFAVLNGASWWLTLLAYSTGGMIAMLLTLTLTLTLAQRRHLPASVPTPQAKLQ